MPRLVIIVIVLFGLTLMLGACNASNPVAPITETPDTEVSATIESTQIVPTESVTETTTPESEANDYSPCGDGERIAVPYFFKDVNDDISPTQVVRFQTTTDNVRRYVSVISCLVYDEGWVSDPAEVENGYENVIVFFDKNGKGHAYRIIIGGHYIAPYDPLHKDVTGSLNGVDEQFFTIDEWIGTTRSYFQTMGVRQIGIDLYLEDTQGNLSRVLEQVYQFKDTNLLIESSLNTGEGYPDQVPDGFFLFATKSWLITPD
mgnify:FL=1